MKETCKDCGFALQTGLWEQAECRRHSPKDLDRGKCTVPRYIPRWPLVRFEDWCGDFKKKDDAQ